MKGVLGLIFALVFSGVAVYLRERFSYDNGAFGLILSFGLIVAGGIAFHDRIKSLKGLGCEVELAEKRIDEAKDKAIAEIREEVKRHSDTLKRLETARAEFMYRDGSIQPHLIYTDESGRDYTEYEDADGTRQRRYVKRPQKSQEREKPRR